MFPTFIGILDIQSWWEVPSIAHFCSLFRDAFNLLDFDIEDLEEALLTDGGTEGHLLQELIVRLLEGCLPHDSRNDISTFNYQMFLRRLFRKKCQEYNCKNPFNTDVDFELLPLRQKVEILHALCDFRLDAKDVEESLSNLDSDSLRVEPLGHDRKNSAYWYFYGTRLYREDYVDTSEPRKKSRAKDKRRKKRKSRPEQSSGEEEEEERKNQDYPSFDENRESIWQVVCFTQQDWSRLVDKFRDSEFDTEQKLYRTLSEDFMPEIPKLFDLKEKQQRRKLLQRNKSRVLRNHEPDSIMNRGKSKSKASKASRRSQKNADIEEEDDEEEFAAPVAPLVQKKGRQTNNSLASAVGQIVIQTRDEVTDLGTKKGFGRHGAGNYVSSSYGYGYDDFEIEEEERRVGMHKVLESLKDHVDAWPFIDPVDEEYAPRYYSVVRKPMDLRTMEEKLDGGSYKSLHQFKQDFRLIVDNCRQYNGSDNEYTEMAVNLKSAFERAVNRFLESEPSSDEDSLSPRSTSGISSAPVRTASPVSSPPPRKRSRKSAKKSKLSRSGRKSKRRSSREEESDKEEEEQQQESKMENNTVEDIEEEEDIAVPDEVVGKVKKSKKGERRPQEEKIDRDSDSAISEANVIKAKRKRHLEETRSVSKSKKASSKDEKSGREQKKDKKSKEAAKENRKRKENFEEDYEDCDIPRGKSRKIEKKEIRDLQDSEILMERLKKSRQKKNESRVNERLDEGEDDVEEDEKKEDRTAKVKAKKSRKKEKAEDVSKLRRNSDKFDIKDKIKEKEKKSKKRSEEKTKNGQLKSNDKVNEDSSSKEDAKKDLESLDSLKDRISERRREEKLKQERERKKSRERGEADRKKVPSNSTYHDGNKVQPKKPKSKKQQPPIEKLDEKKKREDEGATVDSKKNKSSLKKVNREESPAIQALNQATEQTLHDINKWLDDAPRLMEFSSDSNSSVFHPSTSESIRPSGKTNELPRKRPPQSNKLFGLPQAARAKKVQRTIDRLQPGKSKGNLLLKKPLAAVGSTAVDTIVTSQSAADADQAKIREAADEPKLSLGTVLRNADSIQLICKGLVSSPNPNLSNDEDDETQNVSNAVANKKLDTDKKDDIVEVKDESKDAKTTVEESKKPKSATPNLSAWFKAFGAPKSKKKEEEMEEPKKEIETVAVPEVQPCGRQRRASTGGSSVSESLSSFSQESPPGGRSVRSPQSQSVPIPAIEPPIRGAGFYQDALSTGSSPYNSPYYATPPRYSAQLPPTPSPQNHPLSPAYPSPASYEQTPIYQQIPQNARENVAEYRQLNSPQNNGFPHSSPQSPYQQASPQHQQPPTPNYSQPQPSPTPSFSQPSPQQQQPPPNYAPPHSPYSQTSPQQPPNYSQVSPQASNYSQRASPQPPPSFSQPSPQTPPSFSQPSPQQPPPNYSQPSPQTPPTYSQPSPGSIQPQQQQPRNYSHPSPQQPVPSPQQQQFSQPSPQQQFSQPSPQQQQQQQFSQPSPQPPTFIQPQKNDEFQQNNTPAAYSSFKQNPTFVQTAPSQTTMEPDRRTYHKVEEKQPDQRPNFAIQPETTLSHQIYQAPPTQYPPAYGNSFSSGERVPTQINTEPQPLYQTSFQAPPYPMPPASCRSVYPSYFDTKATPTVTTPNNNLAPVKKRMYNEPGTGGGAESGSFEPMIPLSQPEPVPSGQFDSGAFVGSLAESVAQNQAYARLGLGLVTRGPKDQQQQLLTIPRPSPNPEIELNLLQSLQSVAQKGSQPVLSVRRDAGNSAVTAPTATKSKKGRKSKQPQAQSQQHLPVSEPTATLPGYPQYPTSAAESIGLKKPTVVPPGGSAFNFAAASGAANSAAFYDKDASSAAAAAFAFLDEFRNPNSYYSMALRQQQQQAAPSVAGDAQQSCNKLTNQPQPQPAPPPPPPPRNYASPHPFLHSAQRSPAYGPPVPTYVTPHGPNLGVDPAAYQQYLHSLYALQPPHHHRPSWL